MNATKKPRAVVVHFDSGFPLKLENVPNLAGDLEALGAPLRLYWSFGALGIEWSPIYPDAGPGKVARIRLPGFGETRKPLRLELLP